MRMHAGDNSYPTDRDSFKSGVELFYDADSFTYDKDRWTTNAGLSNTRAQIRNIEELGENWSKKKILEVGVGTGRIAAHIAGKGAEVVGVDISEGMLRECRERMRRLQQQRVHVARADGLRLPFESHVFDGCVCINVLSHVPDYRGVLAEIARTLSDKGFAVVNVPNVLSLYFPFGILVNLTNRSIKKNVFTRWYYPSSFLKAARSYGLVCRRVTGQVHIPSGVGIAAAHKLLLAADRLMRSSSLRWFCPILFFRFEKMSSS